jgi:hypothetical protein
MGEQNTLTWATLDAEAQEEISRPFSHSPGTHRRRANGIGITRVQW